MADPAAALARYEELLRNWAPRLNLVATGDLPRLRERHIDDSLRLAPLLEELPEGPCIDVGSGAGLPGIPLAIAGSPRGWRLLEPRRKRAAFLEEVVRELGLEVEVLALSAEQAALDRRLRAGHALAVARALAEPPAALDLLRPLVGAHGIAALYLGRGAEPPPGSEEWRGGIAIVRL
ncbi:MAG: 16S rRNA (guanine(527)-N(7))-methyltransferase RsmG [Actinomycetota bacterium]